MFFIKYIGMYMLIGVAIYIPFAFGLSFYMMHFAKGDIDAYRMALDIITETPHAIEEVERMSKSKEGRKMFFSNGVCNIVTWPITIATLLSRVPEAKQYIIDRRKSGA